MLINFSFITDYSGPQRATLQPTAHFNICIHENVRKRTKMILVKVTIKEQLQILVELFRLRKLYLLVIK